jgi:hypothetical protein
MLRRLDYQTMLVRQRPIRRDVVTVYERTGGDACGGHLVELDCGHTLVIEAVRLVRDSHACASCASAAAMQQLLAEYLPPLTRAA